MAALFVKASSFVVTKGDPHYYTTHGDSGKLIRRGFCRECGSPICTTFENWPVITAIVAAALDDPSMYKPVMDIYTGMAQPWDHMDPGTTKCTAGPPEK